MLHNMLGCVYIWGNISGYIITWLHYAEGGDPGITSGDCTIILPLLWTVSAIFNQLAPQLQRKLNIKILVMLGSGIMLVGIYCASLIPKWKYFVIFYACIIPIGIAFCYYSTIVNAW